MNLKIINPIPDDQKKILISSCLVGINCKYDGKNNYSQILIMLIEKQYFIPIPVCPEQIGGLSTPRGQSEIQSNNENYFDVKVKNIEDEYIEKYFKKGANEIFKIVKLYNINKCLMKENSPSCGVNYIYDGTFTGKKINGMGITSFLLNKNGYELISSDRIVIKKGLVIGLFEEFFEEYDEKYNDKILLKGGFIIV